MDDRTELVLWTAGSILLSFIGALAAWIAVQEPQSRLGRFRSGWSGNPAGHAIVFLVRFAFYLGIPYITLMRHALSLVVIGFLGAETADLPWWTLGWTLADWAGALGWITGLGGIVAVTLFLGWWNVRRAILAHQGGDGFPAGGMAPASSILVVARESIFDEVHWAFYRAVPLLFISDPYWATLAGAALVIVEWVVDPAWHASIRDGSRREAALMQVGWLALSSAVFVMAHNVWPMIVLHVGLAWAIGHWAALLAGRTQPHAVVSGE